MRQLKNKTTEKTKTSGLYSRKVFNHFENPHNYGRMEKPDGVGKVGNLTCLLAGQNIHTSDKLTKIEELKQKDRVLTDKGCYSPIKKLIVRNYYGKIVKIKNKLGEISVTPEHLILAIKPPVGDKYLRTRYRKKLVSAWYHADDLRKEDIVLYPILNEKKDLKYLELDILKSKWDFRSKDIPKRIPLGADLLRFFGYYLAEGDIQDKPSRTFISLSFNINEKDLIEDVGKIVSKVFNLQVKIREIPDRNTTVVYLFSARLARYIKKILNTGAAKKIIPEFIMCLPLEKQRHLIYGLWKGDGYINLDRDGARAGFVTISSTLAQQVKQLLIRHRIIPSLYQDKARTIDGVKHRLAYRIHVGQRESLINLCRILKIKYSPKSYSSEKGWFDEKYLYTSISDVKKEEFSGKVYNLEVPQFHSFISEAFSLHNCGDVMWLYIKVVKNKRGEEVIKDIKFETFGCVAALATSSVITDLAKGKTLEQALKITKSEIVDSLDGLPPIKLHCSVLAADALIEAIYDYYKKNKKPIDRDLEEKHRTIRKSEEATEERYHDWIALEEQMHDKDNGKKNK